MPESVAAGTARMRALAADLPSGFVAGFRLGRDVELPNGTASPRVYAVGMGGSAIAADLVRGVVDAESRAAFTVLRAPELPRAVGASDRVLVVSYSGATWESLTAYATAGRAGAARVVVTSGGPLADRAEADGVPVVRVPPGIPARAAVGPLVGALLGLLDPVFPESNEGRANRIAERLRTEIGRFVRPDGAAATIAGRIADRLPFVFAESGFVPVARRWANQIEENAKRVAAYEEAPEAFHNALVGWDGLRRAEAARIAPVLLEWSGGAPVVRRGFRFFGRTVTARGVRPVLVPLVSDDRLEATLLGVALGDQVSLRLAEQRRVDPCTLVPVERLRAELGRGSAEPSAAPPARRASRRRARGTSGGPPRSPGTR